MYLYSVSTPHKSARSISRRFSLIKPIPTSMHSRRKFSFAPALLLSIAVVVQSFAPARAFQLFPKREKASSTSTPESGGVASSTPMNELTRALDTVQQLVRSFDVCAPAASGSGSGAVLSADVEDESARHKSPLAQIFSTLIGRSAIDVEETASSITFTADVPGIDVEKNLSIEVNVPTNVLTIRGERVEDAGSDVGSDVHKHKRERHFGSFMNKFTLPPHAIVEEISANVKNGVLKIVVPKASAAAQTVKRIPVDVA